MALDPNAVQLLMAVLIGGGVVYIVTRYQSTVREHQAEVKAQEDADAAKDAEIAKLRRRLARLGTAEGAAKAKLERLNHIDDIVRLQTMVAADALDVLGRISPTAVKEVFKQAAPHLFIRNSDELE